MKSRHRGEIGMRAEARVMFKLHQHEVIGKAAQPDPRRRDHPLQPVPGHQQEPAQVQPEFLHHAQMLRCGRKPR